MYYNVEMQNAGRKAEMAVCRALIHRILKAGYAVTVWNGGDEPELKRSTKLADIWNAVGEADMDVLGLLDDGKRIGSITLVWGNSAEELIADYSWVESPTNTLSLIESVVNPQRPAKLED